MKYLPLGKTDIRLSAVIMGTWQAGKTMWAGIEDEQTRRAMAAAFDAGMTTFDTATVYGDGHSERILGQVLGHVRDQVVIATKVFPHSLAYEKVFKACHKSLRDLQTDYIDLYQIHWPAGSFGSKKVPIEETMRALVELKQQGKIRAVGVSNFSQEQIEEALSFGDIESYQPPYSLFWRQMEDTAIAYCRKKGITVLAYSSMAQGILTGKFGKEPRFEKGDHRAKNILFQPEHYSRIQAALESLQPIARRNDLTLGQLALAWVISGKGTCAVAGARNAEQVVQNAKAGGVTLPTDELREIDLIGRTVTDDLGPDPVMWQW